MEFKHTSVLLKECIDGLNIDAEGIYVDCTLGGAGHSSEIVKSLNHKGRLIGIDQDKNALKAASEKLKGYKNIALIHDNFYNIKNILKFNDISNVNGILMDLGVSSHQLDVPKRGFSYMADAPLDMRMNEEQQFSAYELINSYSEEELYKIIRDYGEERFARRIAQFVVREREKKPIDTTLELVDIIKAAIPAKARREGPHPAKRTFQAIRIEVNKELSILEKAIIDSIEMLKPGGRIAIITFHSLEDRIVKQTFKRLTESCECPPDFPICICGKKPLIKLINRKPIGPSEMELEENPRSRSAKLRVAEKL